MGKIFRLGKHVFDVDRGLELAADAPIESVDISGWGDPWEQGVQIYAIYAERLRAKDLEKPILLGTWKGKTILLDGWHRLHAAKKRGLTKLPARVLTAKQTKDIHRKQPLPKQSILDV